MICSMPHLRQNFFEIIGVPLSFSSSYLNPLDCAISDVLENKTNATSNPNLSLLKTDFVKEWNKKYV